MKMFLALLTLVTLQTAFAQEYTKLKDGDMNLSGAEAKITSVKPVCPRVPGQVSCMAYGSIVKIKVSLNGCLDTLGGHFSSFKIVNGKGVLAFGAINIANESSRVAMCYALPVEIVTIHVPFEGKVELEKMEFRGNILPQY
ncbi:MAG: hypothetical protein H0V66_13200 [Bdellovibrionales bacterium]|nr:hypothetical protein [Bdellovibrionales bacterium]